MKKSGRELIKRSALMMILGLMPQAFAQNVSEAVLFVSAVGEATHANDLANAAFRVEARGKDKTQAVNTVNDNTKKLIEVLKRTDPTAKLKTTGYQTYELRNFNPQTKKMDFIGWKVEQSVNMTTQVLDALPKAAASAQSYASLAWLNFSLSPEALASLESQRLQLAYQNLAKRIAAITTAAGRPAEAATIEVLDFEGGHVEYGAPRVPESPRGMENVRAFAAAPAPMAMAKRGGDQEGESAIAETSFEPGETTLSTQLTARVRLK